METLRNVRTGEIQEIEPYSDDWNDKLAEVYDAGGGVVRPSWEQQGQHVALRLKEGDAQVPHDFGYEDKPLHIPGAIRAEDILADPRPHEELTAAEKEMGIKDWDQKKKELGETRGEIFDHDALGSTPVADRLEQGLDRVTGDGSGKRRTVKRTSSAKTSSASGSGSSSGSGSAATGGSAA